MGFGVQENLVLSARGRHKACVEARHADVEAHVELKSHPRACKCIVDRPQHLNKLNMGFPFRQTGWPANSRHAVKLVFALWLSSKNPRSKNARAREARGRARRAIMCR